MLPWINIYLRSGRLSWEQTGNFSASRGHLPACKQRVRLAAYTYSYSNDSPVGSGFHKPAEIIEPSTYSNYFKELTMRKILAGIFTLLISLGPVTSVFAGHADGAARAARGTVACGGNQVIRDGGNEFQAAIYVLRNYDPSISINIDRIRFYDSHGVLTHDFAGALPTFVNGVLSPVDSTLEPNQTAQLRSWDIFGLTGLPLNERPIQMIIDWSANGRPLLLEAGLVRVARDRIVTPTGVTLGAERSRHHYDCRTIHTSRR